MEKKYLYYSGEEIEFFAGENAVSFNEDDFKQRIEYAAKKLKFIDSTLEEDELDDLVCVLTNQEIADPPSALAEHLEENQDVLRGGSTMFSSFAYWMKRLIFREAVLDQKLLDGELDVDFDPKAGVFTYVQVDAERTVLELTPTPSWEHIAYRRES